MNNNIINLICQIANLKSGNINIEKNFRYIGLTSSIKLIRLHRNIEKEIGRSIRIITPDTLIKDVLVPEVYIAPTIETSNIDSHQNSLGNQKSAQSQFDICIGIDLEEVNHFPLSADYEHDNFYTDIFDSEEIKYAVRNKDPRIHFCGFFCAKEALIKCNAQFSNLDLKQIGIRHATTGAPYITLTNPSIMTGTIKLSISHTEKYATAVVLLQVAVKY